MEQKKIYKSKTLHGGPKPINITPLSKGSKALSSSSFFPLKKEKEKQQRNHNNKMIQSSFQAPATSMILSYYH
jgi:hypothetical protein